jgi:hypothetical protein
MNPLSFTGERFRLLNSEIRDNQMKNYTLSAYFLFEQADVS